jgi:hypothetical protein
MTRGMALMITAIGVHDPPESMFTIKWTECSRSTGIGVQDPPERAPPPEQNEEFLLTVL